jgi:(S)-sulfolactate dehydrogenase
MSKIVITEFMDETFLPNLREHHEVIYEPDLVDREDQLYALLHDMGGLIVRNRTSVGRALLDNAPNLSAIGRLGVGLDNIDITLCKERGIEVYPALGANNTAVAEYVVAALLILFRGAFNATSHVIEGKWPRTALIGKEISGKTLGVIGYGGIAREVETRATVMGVRVIAYDPYVSNDNSFVGSAALVQLDELLTGSDAISLHLPLTSETRGLISHEHLAKMKPGSVLINTSRGGIVDEGALVAALRSNRLSGAAIDVYEHEPLTEVEARQFEGIDNLILTPHIAGITEEANARISEMIVKKMINHFRNQK